MDKLLEYINNNKDSLQNGNYILFFDKLEQFMDENNIMLDDKLIKRLLDNSPLLRLLLEKVSKDANECEANSLINRFLSIYLNLVCEDIETSTYNNDLIHEYIRKSREYAYLDNDPEALNEIVLKAVSGDKNYQEILLTYNFRLVVKIASRYKRIDNELEDLVQEGNLGLLKAMEKYDITKGTKFSTYAVWWIRQFITRSIAQNSNMGYHSWENYNKYISRYNAYITQYGSEPSDEEMADILGISVEKVISIRASKAKQISIEETLEDEATRFSGEAEFADYSMNDVMNSIDDKDETSRYLNILSERERKVLSLRYGLEDGREWTLDAIGQSFELTRERIRVIADNGLGKIRSRKSYEEAKGKKK